MAWSIVSLFTYRAHNFGTMVAFRFLLGITEAPVSHLLVLNDPELTSITVLPWCAVHDQHVLHQERDGYSHVYPVQLKHAC